VTRSTRLLGLAALAALGIGFVFAVNSPPDRIQGNYSRIMYVHVPSAWLAFLSFGVTLAGGVMWLWRRSTRWDRIAASSAEVGVFFTALALMTGMIWGYPVWGTFWDWGDARMMSTAIMFFVYLGYLSLRRSIPEPELRAQRSAVLGTVSFITVPLVYLSTYLFRTLHQGSSIRESSIDTPILVALMVNLAAFTIVYLAFLAARTGLARRQDEVEEAEAAADFGLAGSGVTAPNLRRAT
jgi:heme exporter protein C